MWERERVIAGSKDNQSMRDSRMQTNREAGLIRPLPISSTSGGIDWCQTRGIISNRVLKVFSIGLLGLLAFRSPTWIFPSFLHWLQSIESRAEQWSILMRMELILLITSHRIGRPTDRLEWKHVIRCAGYFPDARSRPTDSVKKRLVRLVAKESQEC